LSECNFIFILLRTFNIKLNIYEENLEVNVERENFTANFYSRTVEICEL